MKISKIIASVAAAALSAAIFAGCGSIPENTIFSIDDLNGKVIGVQGFQPCNLHYRHVHRGCRSRDLRARRLLGKLFFLRRLPLI